MVTLAMEFNSLLEIDNMQWSSRRPAVQNVKELYHASLLTHDLFTWFDDFTTALRLTSTHNSRLIRKKHTVPLQGDVVSNVEQCHIWGDITRAAYVLVWLCIDKRNRSQMSIKLRVINVSHSFQHSTKLLITRRMCSSPYSTENINVEIRFANFKLHACQTKCTCNVWSKYLWCTLWKPLPTHSSWRHFLSFFSLHVTLNSFLLLPIKCYVRENWKTE